MFARTIHVAVSVDVNSGVSHVRTRRRRHSARPPLTSALMLSLVLVLVISITGALSLISRAHSVVAHPEVCLGGWSESHQASGEPEYQRGVALSVHTSALLPEDTAAEVFCSKFNTEIPEGTIPTALTLELILARAPVSEVIPVVSASPDEPMSDDAEPRPSVEVPANEVNQNAERDDSPEVVVPPDQIPPVETPSEEPSAWFQFLFGIAHAEELTSLEPEQGIDEIPAAPLQDSVTPLTPPVVPESVELPPQETEVIDEGTEESDAAAPSAEILFETGAVVPLAVFEQDRITVGEAATSTIPVREEGIQEPVPSEVSATPGSDPLIEVLVTFDGVFWQTLGTLSEEGFADARFDIPIPGDFDWKTIPEIQVLVRPLITPVSRPAVLLDGMSLSVEYETLSSDVAPLAALLSEDHAFTLDNRFVLDLKASRGHVLVKTVTADSRTELYVVPLDDARPALRVANESWIAPDSPIGIFEGFAFWVSPSGDVYGFSLARSRFIAASFLGEAGDNVETFKPERLSFGVTVRGTEFAFTDNARGEITSDDDALLKEQFIQRMFETVPTTRNDLIDLHLVPPIPEEHLLDL